MPLTPATTPAATPATGYGTYRFHHVPAGGWRAPARRRQDETTRDNRRSGGPMAGRGLLIVVATASAALVLPGIAAAAPATASQAACSAGAHTLAPPGSRLYPDTGNGGYTSQHTLVHLVYDATANRFLPGNKVILTDRATQCLTSFSLDFERKSANTSAGPDMSVQSV